MRALSSILAVAIAGCTFGEPETTLVVKGVSTPALLALNPASVLPRVSLCGDPVVPPAVAPEFSILGDGFELTVVRPEGSVFVAIPTVTISDIRGVTPAQYSVSVGYRVWLFG